MKLTELALRKIINEEIKSSRKQMEFDLIKDDLQEKIIEAIVSGDISSENDLDEYHKTIDAAVKNLKTLPYDFLVKKASEIK